MIGILRINIAVTCLIINFCIFYFSCTYVRDLRWGSIPCPTVYIHWVTCVYTLGNIHVTQCIYVTYIKCIPMYIYLSPNVYSIYIGYIHWVASEYTLGCKTYTLGCIFCHTMYIQKNVTQCIYVKMHCNVYTQCI